MKDKNKVDRNIAAAIFLSGDIEQNFKYYSYRLLSPEVFIERIDELIQVYQKAKEEIGDQPEVVETEGQMEIAE